MTEAVERVVRDAQTFVTRAGFTITDEALALIRDAEALASHYDSYIAPHTFLTVMLARLKPLRAALARLGTDPDQAVKLLAEFTAKQAGPMNSYDTEDTYSSIPSRSFRASLIIRAIRAAEREGSPVTGLALLEAILGEQEESMAESDGAWAITTPTLSDVIWESGVLRLPVRFSELRDELGMPHPETSLIRPVDVAPPSIRSAVQSLLVDHPNYARNCFLIMPFAETPMHKGVFRLVRETMTHHGFFVLRADDKVYSEDVLTNVQAYTYGCRLAIAVFDRLLSDEFNPNVSLEVGYCLGLRKPVCLLKEQTLRRLPSDLAGRLYVEFDGQKIEESIPAAVERWLSDRGFIDGSLPRAGVE